MNTSTTHMKGNEMITKTIMNPRIKWPHNRQIIKITDEHGGERYLVKQGSKYIGKTKYGGYKSYKCALNCVTR